MSKRGKNEGTIRKRSDGRWEGRVMLGYRNGKRVRPSFYAKSRGEVQQSIGKAIRDFQQGLPAAPERQSVKNFLERWLEETARPRLRRRTFDGYQQHVRKHIEPCLGHVPLHQLTPQNVQKMIKTQSDVGLSPRTVRYTRAVLRTALNQALKWNLVARNAAALVDVPRSTRHEIRVLDPEESRGLLKAAEASRLGALFSVALAVGLRLGEALALGWADVDLDKKALRVRRALQRIDKKLQFVEPKSERSRRAVNIPQFAVSALKRHAIRQKKERLLAGGRWRESGLVFTSTIGTPLDERNVRREFRAILKAAKLPPMRIHDLRHTCASLLLAQGVHARVVMEVLGHSQISLTMDTYSHVSPALHGEAAQKMDSLLAQK